jgi:Protein of unknown function (DUF732)
MNISRVKNGRTKHLAGTVSAVAAAVVLTGAVGSGTAWADTGSSGGQTLAATYTPNTLADDVYVKTLRDADAGWPATTSNADLIRMGHESCTALDSGQTLVQVAGFIHSMSPSTSWESAGYLVGASAAAYCPHHVSAIMDQAQQLSPA